MSAKSKDGGLRCKQLSLPGRARPGQARGSRVGSRAAKLHPPRLKLSLFSGGQKPSGRGREAWQHLRFCLLLAETHFKDSTITNHSDYKWVREPQAQAATCLGLTADQTLFRPVTLYAAPHRPLPVFLVQGASVLPTLVQKSGKGKLGSSATPPDQQ